MYKIGKISDLLENISQNQIFFETLERERRMRKESKFSSSISRVSLIGIHLAKN